jgi:hypothetical protein
MKNLLLSILVLLFATNVSAQTVSLTWGPEMKRPGGTDISGLIGADKESFYCLRTSNSIFSSKTSLEKYNKTTIQLEYVKEFEMPEMNGKKLLLGGIYILKGKMLLFASRYDKDEDKNYAYVQKMNASDGSLDGKPKEIDYIASTKKRNAGSFNYVLSEDSSKILLLHNEPFEKYGNEKFSYKVLDNNANELWSAALELPYKDKSFTISNYRVDNDGNVFMLASIIKDKDERKDRSRPGYRYELISYNYKTKNVSETEIALEDKFISDISFRINAKGNIVIGGFYSNKTSDGLAGTFFLSMDRNSRKVISSGYKDFSTEFLGEFMSARRAEKHKELYNYSIDYLVTRDDGGAIMVAEQYYVQIYQYTDPRTGYTTYTYHYYYNDIIVVNVNPDASIAWVKKIPKLQHSTNDYGYYSSYTMDVVGDKLYFIYNDNPKNLTVDATKVKNGITKKMVTVLAIVDSKGNLERNVMFSAKDARIRTRPKISLQLGPKESLFYAIKGKKYKFGRVNYP